MFTSGHCKLTAAVVWLTRFELQRPQAPIEVRDERKPVRDRRAHREHTETPLRAVYSALENGASIACCAQTSSF